MSRSRISIIGFALLCACTIEETPQQYIDRRDNLADQIAVSEEELARRLGALPSALGAGADSAVLALLRPDSVTIFLTPTSADTVTSGQDLVQSLRDVEALAAADLRVLWLRVDSNNEVAWFAAVYAVAADPTQEVRFSGAFNRSAGEWFLVNGHLSTASLDPTRSAP